MSGSMSKMVCLLSNFVPERANESALASLIPLILNGLLFEGVEIDGEPVANVPLVLTHCQGHGTLIKVSNVLDGPPRFFPTSNKIAYSQSKPYRIFSSRYRRPFSQLEGGSSMRKLRAEIRPRLVNSSTSVSVSTPKAKVGGQP